MSRDNTNRELDESEESNESNEPEDYTVNDNLIKVIYKDSSDYGPNLLGNVWYEKTRDQEARFINIEENIDELTSSVKYMKEFMEMHESSVKDVNNNLDEAKETSEKVKKTIDNIYASLITIIVALLGVGVLYTTISTLISNSLSELFKYHHITARELIVSTMTLSLGSIICYMLLIYFLFAVLNQFIFESKTIVFKFNNTTNIIFLISLILFVIIIVLINWVLI